MADEVPKGSDGAEESGEARLDEIEQAAQRAADRLLGIDDTIGEAAREFEEGAQIDDEFDRRLTDLERRAGAQKATREARKEQEARRQAKDADAARGLGVGMTAAYAILGMPLLGAGLGWLVDQRLGTNVWLGLGMLAGATAGVGFALFVLQRSGRGS